jgi:two-component system NarL family sensor kinase
MQNEKVTAKMVSASTDTITDICNYLKQFSCSLNTEIVRKEGIKNIIGRVADKLDAAKLLEVKTSFSGDPVWLAPERELLILQVMQEALVNAIRHSEATRVTISLHYQPNDSEFAVVDNGKGFQYPATGYTGSGTGLKSIVANARALKGMYNIFTSPGSGTLIFLSFPNREKYKNSSKKWVSTISW